MDKLNIYSASAGAGKTYTLTQEYLKLVFKSPYNYKRILAVTFTNKATEEMKSRIIESLAELASGSQKDHYEVLSKHCGKEGAVFQLLAKDILSNILHDYSHFAVTTIDSFFQRVLKGFVKELGVHGGFNVELNQEKVIESVSRSMIAKIGKDEQLKEWIFDFVQDNVEKGKGWNVYGVLQELGREVLNENFRIIESKGFGTTGDTKALKAYLEELKASNGSFEESLKGFGKKGLKLMQEHDVDYTDFSYGKNGFASYFVKLADGKIEVPSKRVKDAIDNVDKWCAKKSEKKNAIEAVYFNGLNELLKEILEFYFGNVHFYHSNQAILSSIYVYGVYKNIIEEIKAYRDDNGVLLISDVSSLLNDIIGSNNAPYIYEKVGSFYKHYLIDEFQDTSRLQWFNFKPLLENGLGEGKGSLIVGDVKQAIYRWRGGDWRLLLEDVENEIGSNWINHESLHFNYRSTKEVIDFNNTLFHVAPKLLEGYFEDELNAVKGDAYSEDWQERYDLIQQYFSGKVGKAYSDAFQKFPNKNTEQGEVLLKFKDGEEEGDYNSFVELQLKEQIDRLLDQGEQLKDIAVLVRSKREAKWVSDTLNDFSNEGERNYPSIVSGALRYESNAAIRLLLRLMQYLQEPNDRINLYELLQLKAEIKGGEFDSSEFLKVNGDTLSEYLPEEFLKHQAQLSKMPIFELVQTLMIQFELTQKQSDWAFLMQFNDMLVNYTRKNNPDLSSFLTYWEENGKDKSPVLSGEQDAIQIQTVHKSKGLQYKNVIVPFCNWSFHHNPRHTNLIWAYSDEKPYDAYPYFPVNFNKALERSIYSIHYFDEMLQVLMENLNILYVACTRAEKSLICFGEKPKKKKSKISALNASDVLLDLMVFSQSEKEKYIDCSENWNEDLLEFRFGQLDSSSSSSKELQLIDLEFNDYHLYEYRNRLSIRKKSEQFFKKEQNEEQKSLVNHGLLMHEVLGELHEVNDLENALMKLCQEGRLKLDEKDGVKKQMNELLSDPQIGAWFDGSWKVKNEQLIIDPSSKFDKRPDRVMVKGDEVVVVDFKFGMEKSNQYHGQVRRYMNLLKEMTNGAVKGYLLYGELKEVEEVKFKESNNNEQLGLF